MLYDYLIVGAGVFGSTFARLATDDGKRCLVIDKRNHIAGNCYTEHKDGINIHKYGPHIFHTSNEKIWEFVNRFSKFNKWYNEARFASSNLKVAAILPPPTFVGDTYAIAQDMANELNKQPTTEGATI